MEGQVLQKSKLAKCAAAKLAILSTEVKNNALLSMAKSLREKREDILAANETDLINGRKQGLSQAMLERLLLDEQRIESMATGLEEVALLPDPIGSMTGVTCRPNGLQIGKMRVPLGVIGIIYESRPNVTVDAAALCLKSGNAVLLRGGSEAINSNIAIAQIIAQAAKNVGVPDGAIQLITTTEREAVEQMMTMNEYLDVLIPRGGAGLIQTVVKNATVPVIETGVGNCHLYVDSSANLEMAKKILINGKTQRPAVCNALETLLVHQDIAEEFLSIAAKALQDKNVEIRGCAKTREILSDVREAAEEDWAQEYLNLLIAVKVVENIEEALEHISCYGTGHSEVIITENYSHAHLFTSRIDAAAVYVNASSRFTDGSEFGLGAEIGISTQKMHARGPMGLEALTSNKYVIWGQGQIR